MSPCNGQLVDVCRKLDDTWKQMQTKYLQLPFAFSNLPSSLVSPKIYYSYQLPPVWIKQKTTLRVINNINQYSLRPGIGNLIKAQTWKWIQA